MDLAPQAVLQQLREIRGEAFAREAGGYDGAKAEFGRWTKNAGKVMSGLVRRRAAEAELYAKP